MGPHGVAFDSTLLVLKIVGVNLDGQTASSTGPIPESDHVNPGLIAPALRYAVDKGAFVSALPVNGVATGQMAADQRAAMVAVRQADRLVVESMWNVTDENSFKGQIAENLVGTDLANKDWSSSRSGSIRAAFPAPPTATPASWLTGRSRLRATGCRSSTRTATT